MTSSCTRISYMYTICELHVHVHACCIHHILQTVCSLRTCECFRTHLHVHVHWYRANRSGCRSTSALASPGLCSGVLGELNPGLE